MLKKASGCVLASLNASTYWKVRLGISFAAALLDGHFEQPAGSTAAANGLIQPCIPGSKIAFQHSASLSYA
jgi:hypothetical protein